MMIGDRCDTRLRRTRAAHHVRDGARAVRVLHNVFGRRPDGHVRAVVQLDYREVIKVHLSTGRFPDAHCVPESQPSAQRMVIDVRVVLGDALRVPVAVRSGRQHSFVSETVATPRTIR